MFSQLHLVLAPHVAIIWSKGTLEFMMENDADNNPICVKCDICDKEFNTSNKRWKFIFKRHKKSHESPEFTCHVCGVNFARKDSLLKHEKKHSDSYNCTTCKKIFTQKDNLIRHQKKHKAKENFICHCGKQFLRKDNLQRHSIHCKQPQKNKHPITRGRCKNQLQCHICGKVFARKDVLKRHIASHQSQLHSCEECGKS